MAMSSCYKDYDECLLSISVLLNSNKLFIGCNYSTSQTFISTDIDIINIYRLKKYFKSSKKLELTWCAKNAKTGTFLHQTLP